MIESKYESSCKLYILWSDICGLFQAKVGSNMDRWVKSHI